MSLPTMSVINFASLLDDREVQHAVRAVNRQVAEDFAPIWGAAYSLRLHASQFDPTSPNILTEETTRGESVMYLVDEASVSGALGYHTRNSINIPVGFVFVTDADDWTTTLSHEVLELIVDPTVNVMVPGPDPRAPNNTVLHTYEVCDAVERTSYFIDEIEVSNFITPSWFTPGDELGTRNDYLGIGVQSFDAIQDSHLAFYDLSASEWVTYWGSFMPTMNINARRAMNSTRKAKKRNNELIQGTFNACHNHKELPHLHGLTRTARYQARVEDMFSSKHYHPELAAKKLKAQPKH